MNRANKRANKNRHTFSILFVAAVASGWYVQTGAWAAADLPAVTVQAATQSGLTGYEATVEAVRQTTVSAQVPGTVLQVMVKAGQQVQAGQMLLRIDGAAAQQGSVAAAAQRDMAAADLNRKRQLYAKGYISKVALDQAEAVLKGAQAQATASGMQAGFYAVKAPYSGTVAAVMVEQGETAMPGRPLFMLYAPGDLRVTAAVPASVLAGGDASKAEVELAGQAQRVQPVRVEVLPTVDPRSLSRQVRAYLPAEILTSSGATPGGFARLWLAGAAGGTAGQAAGAEVATVQVPQAAVVRRGEMTGVYVLGKEGKPLLRQVRLGLRNGDLVQVLSGVQPGEKVVTQPLRAAAVQ
jgi:multidrug efflux system membrane fusion protein